MATQPKRYISPQEYLAIERKAEFKSEYHSGEMFAMAGASDNHEAIIHNLDFVLGLQLRKRPCRIYVGNTKVFVTNTGLYAYPDLAVVCGKREFSDEVTDVLLNPEVLIEVLSESTEKYDRGTKFMNYQSIPSLREYVLVSQDRTQIEIFRRQDGEMWLYAKETNLDGTIKISSIDCALELKEVYHQVEFEKF